MPRFFLLSGSVSETSKTRALVEHVAACLCDRGAEVVVWDLMSCPLPIASTRTSETEEVREFLASVASADGFTLGSPLYHGSYSGVLKNALDHLPRGAFEGRPVGLLSHGSSSCSSAPCRDLEPVVRALKGYAAQTSVSTDETSFDGMRVTDARTVLRLGRLADELLRLANVLGRIRLPEGPIATVQQP